ncbi:unnamed protein product [Trichogramma brassicae]|uniref:Uncharacterized protein n=1 Tax=Trichogramma brassicae TaxID=86971 RepID=A0A6H5I3A7_9HYME|nr:unnamed protein product [Trichogramma brassicae]
MEDRPIIVDMGQGAHDVFFDDLLMMIQDQRSYNNAAEEARLHREHHETLRNMRASFNWEAASEVEKYQFYRRLIDLTYHWNRGIVNLRDIFRPEEIEHLLIESVIDRADDRYFQKERFIEHVALGGYKDEPLAALVVDESDDGRPLSSPRRRTPLHLALRVEPDAVRYLFDIYDRFDVNYADESGLTHFHVACWKQCGDIVDRFLEHGHDPNRRWPVTGDSALHMAAANGRREVIASLLGAGADPNLLNDKGSTAFHLICKGDYEEDLVNEFFELSRENNHTVPINAQDNDGNTLLILTLDNGYRRLVESLLRQGADPNLAEAEGLTPLHVICKSLEDDDLVDLFFDVNDQLRQTVQIDKLDNVGMTPLKWAVVNLLPHVLDVLLDRGADISNFAFPAEDYFYESLEDYEWTASELLRQASGILSVVERLERRGNELGRSDALMIMTFFDKNRLFLYPEYPAELESCWRSDAFVRTARGIMINPNLSLYDLMRLRPEEAENRVTYAEYFELACTKKLEVFPVWSHLKPCVLHLCEKLARGFFRRWALNSLLELTRDRLPYLCCDAIVEQLTNKDLGLICRWIYHWDRYLPDVRDIFTPEQIDYLLKESVIERHSFATSFQGGQFIKFVLRARYQDQPDVDKDGRPSSRRTTPLHHVSAATGTRTVQYLFKIYNRFDVNYIDESGLTHFHVACWKGFHSIVDEFLEHGQDPNLLVRETGDSPLHFAVAESFYRKILVESLLRKGANPNLANAKGSTALHVICKEDYEYYEQDLVNTFFELSSEHNHPVLINAQDNEGNTPLQLAAGKGNKYVVEYLLRRGADSSLANAEGLTALHAICKGDYEKDLVNAFFELSRENNHPLLIDAQDNEGNTPLQLAAGKGNKNVVEYLLRRGATRAWPMQKD